ncbi:outer membrane beta-barrel protein [Steroidobacter sp.]|uniref:outer membrane beta-barrel protein n=1 Tax=Steroidobacter sp. TaxID=1978227 RepID=UPI001A5DA755|nr:outer membrane beta-barrel protein [Steroidobacter sp.]MBL8268138.1 porin family protein [Steroidobacter sp.]
MNRAIVAATLLALSSGAAYAQSPENDSGLYIGGGVGQFDIEIDGVDGIDEAIGRLDDSDTAWQAFIGWRLNPYISLQAAYVDYGGPNDDFSTSGSSGNYSASLSGFAPSIIGTLPLGPVELSAKLGYYFYDLDVSIDIDDPLDPDSSSSDSGEDVFYGVGVGMTFFDRLHAKLEYEKIDLKGVDDSNAFWFTGQWRF